MPRRPNNPSEPAPSEPRVLVLGADSSLATTCCAALARAGCRLLLLGDDETALADLDNRLVQNELHAYRAASLVAGLPEPDELHAILGEWNPTSDPIAAVVTFLPAVTSNAERSHIEPGTAEAPLAGLIRSLPSATQRTRWIVVGHSPALPVAVRSLERPRYDDWRSAVTRLAADGCKAYLVWASGVFPEASLIEIERRAAASGCSPAERLRLELAGSVDLDAEQLEARLVASEKGSNPNHRDAVNPFEWVPDGTLTALDVAGTLLSMLEPHAARLSGNGWWLHGAAG